MSRAWASNQGGECREYCPRQRDVTVKAVVESTEAQPAGSSRMAPVRHLACPDSCHLFEEGFHIKHCLSCKDVVGSSGEVVSHDGQRLCFSVFFLESGPIGFCLVISPQKEDDRFGEGPLEVYVSDLASGTALFLPRRFLGRFDEPAVGGEVLDLGKAPDVVDLIEDGKAENASYPGDGSYPEVGVAVMLFSEGGYFLLELREDCVVEIEKVQVELNALLDARVGKELGYFLSLGLSAGVSFPNWRTA